MKTKHGKAPCNGIFGMNQRMNGVLLAGWVLMVSGGAAWGVDPNFVFSKDYLLPLATPTSMVAADLDGDEFPEIVVGETGSSSSSIRVISNLTSLTGDVRPYPVGLGVVDVKAVDFDGDEFLDLVTANLTSNSVSVLRNEGNGIFSPAVNYAAGPLPTSVTAGDINGDDLVDLIVSHQTVDYITILYNQGDGTFGGAANFASGGAGDSVVAFELGGDADSYSELATVNRQAAA